MDYTTEVVLLTLKPSHGLKIVDLANGGGPVDTYVLKNQANNSPSLNADSYRWFAQVCCFPRHWFSHSGGGVAWSVS